MFSTAVITIFFLIVLLFSVIIHELSHGYVANSLGDPTAKYAGRLTLNPIKHLDPFGSVILPLLFLLISFLPGGQPFIFGWAKPVPINPYNFKDQKWGTLKVSIAGPLSNFAVALVFGLFIRFFSYPQLAPLIQLFSIIVFLNILLGLFNLIPIPPLDGSWILFRFLPAGAERVRVFLQQYGFFIIIFLLFSGILNGVSVLINLIFYAITGTYFGIA
ncbi:MAG: site-2 protease family protein [Candidatus Staskawiczbacteria bacterium]|nr:site-2 protease family protein [Candidatus Staskawiczbacteria bacterium]